MRNTCNICVPLWIAAVFMALEDLSDLSVAAKTDNKTLTVLS